MDAKEMDRQRTLILSRIERARKRRRRGPNVSASRNQAGRLLGWWLEDRDLPLRPVGRLSEIRELRGIRSLDHGGWYTDDSCCDRTEGYVFQLPARDGETRYMAARTDPYNGELFLYPGIHDTLEDAAYRADREAELWAEREREYNETSREAFRYQEMREELAELRRDIRNALKAVPRPSRTPEVCAALRPALRRLLAERAKLQEEIAEHWDTNSYREGWAEAVASI